MSASPNPHFTIGPELDGEIERAARALCEAVHPVALTGAGLSVESGIPPFRGPGGLWTKYGEPPMDGYERFLRDPAKYWRERLHPTAPWAKGLAETLAAARPNAGHRALVALERAGRLDAVITQNIDDLHRQAGQQNLLEIHGNHALLRCVGCNQRFAPDAPEIEIDEGALPPCCPRCEGTLKGDTVHFGEPIPRDVLAGCEAVSAECDCMLLVGTSATVYPAAGFALAVGQRGGLLIEVNPYESDLSSLMGHSLRGPAAAILERLASHVEALSAPQESAHGG